MRHRRKDILQKEHIIFLGDDQASDPLDILQDAWEDLVFESDVEERSCFIELTERLLKSYSNSDSAGLYSEDRNIN